MKHSIFSALRSRLRKKAGRSPLPAQGRGIDKLFRTEVLEARQDRWYGRPQIATPLSARVTAPAAIAAAVAIAGLLAFGTYTRRATVEGVQLPAEGVTKVTAPQPGRITELAVSEGQAVIRGDLLYVVDLDSVSSVGGTQRAVTDELRRQRVELEAERKRRSELDAAQKRGVTQQAADVALELEQVDQQIVVAGEYVESLRAAFDRYKDFAGRQIVVQMQVDAKEQAFMSERQRLETLRRERLQLSTKRAELRSQAETADGRAASAQSELTRQIAQIDQAIAEGEAKRAIRLTAPRDGIVTGIVARVGEVVAAGMPMVTILPGDARLQAQLGAPSSAIGFIQTGQAVMLRYQAFPHQKFGQYPGRVSAISRTALRPGEFADLRPAAANGAETGTNGQNLYRITVEPERAEVDAYGQAQKLSPGMLVQATIFLDRRPLYQWVLDPLYSLRGVTGGEAPVPAPASAPVLRDARS
jgi:membrane fusion protein